MLTAALARLKRQARTFSTFTNCHVLLRDWSATVACSFLRARRFTDKCTVFSENNPPDLAENAIARYLQRPTDSVYSQSFLLWDVKRGSHVDQGGKAVQVVTVGMRKDGVCLNKRGAGGGKRGGGGKRLLVMTITVYSVVARTFRARLLFHVLDFKVRENMKI